jgi:hypothetical protein
VFAQCCRVSFPSPYCSYVTGHFATFQCRQGNKSSRRWFLEYKYIAHIYIFLVYPSVLSTVAHGCVILYDSTDSVTMHADLNLMNQFLLYVHTCTRDS